MYEYYGVFEELGELLDGLDDIMYSFGYATEMGMVSFILICTIIGLIIGGVIALLLYVLEAIPVYKLAKKMGMQNAWLAWVPIYGSYFRFYVLSEMAGNKPLVILKNKFKFENRKTAFWIYVGVSLLGSLAVAVICAIGGFFPIIGQIISMLSWCISLLPAAVAAVFEYAILRDVANIFKSDRKANTTTALILALLDQFVTMGIARTVYLYTLLKCDPLPDCYDVEEEASNGGSYTIYTRY